MTAPTDITSARKRVLAPTDCGLCSHPAHSVSECPVVNEHGLCCCWQYLPASEFETRSDAA